jgi:transposase-like protein
MDEWFARDLSGIDFVVVMLDGVHVADHVILVAVGIDSDGCKPVLGIREGATENATHAGSCSSSFASMGW